jgi:hypothetical protein
MAEFDIECFQNEFLPAGGTLMNAVITVTARGTSPGTWQDRSDGGPGQRAEILILDTSGSMQWPKLAEAKAAAAAAIDYLPDGVRFAVVSGNHEARVAYPARPTLAEATPTSRGEAKEAIRRLDANGGTAIGSWISMATELLRDEPGIRHAILLTDGKNESESRDDLDRALAEAEGVFQCDCRGVGADFVVAELMTIANALLGTQDIVPDPADLKADFASMMQASLSRQVGAVTLRVWTPQGGEVVVLKQMEPVVDLAGARLEVSALVGEYPTGSWGDETRDYHLCVRMPAGEVVDEKMAAARVTLVVDGEAAGQTPVLATWTDDVAQSTRINRRVAEVMSQTVLADAIQKGVDALRAHDTTTATDELGHAAQLAHESDNSEVLDRLSKLVDIEDPATGRVKPKAKVDEVDVMIAESRSVRTERTRR